jgi:hypothetical protein
MAIYIFKKGRERMPAVALRVLGRGLESSFRPPGGGVSTTQRAGMITARVGPGVIVPFRDNSVVGTLSNTMHKICVALDAYESILLRRDNFLNTRNNKFYFLQGHTFFMERFLHFM